ncbi:isoprenylcysteine carboxylmethyltransferase family protein [bacterium]|nr:isoprenylcysteine carboxylmethyltransferase family protein [bacterium]
MFSLFIRNLIFTILQPGIVAGLIPYLILGNKVNDIFVQQLLPNGLHNSGAIIFVIGFVIMVSCIISFAVKGRGTLSPADPTKKLVTTGLYKFSRNPMYVGVTLILIGEAIFFQSVVLLIYSLSIFIAFNIFTILVEEPRLRNNFGEEYKKYCDKVRRWI